MPRSLLPSSKRHIGGLTILDVRSREEALQWATKIAVACRCPQEFREVGPDPAVGAAASWSIRR